MPFDISTSASLLSISFVYGESLKFFAAISHPVLKEATTSVASLVPKLTRSGTRTIMCLYASAQLNSNVHSYEESTGYSVVINTKQNMRVLKKKNLFQKWFVMQCLYKVHTSVLSPSAILGSYNTKFES